MALDKYNWWLEHVSAGNESKYKAEVPDVGKIVFLSGRRYVSLGDGVTKGGSNLAGKNWVLETIKKVEQTGSVAGIDVD